jgi:hypothetical protein
MQTGEKNISYSKMPGIRIMEAGRFFYDTEGAVTPSGFYSDSDARENEPRRTNPYSFVVDWQISDDK